MKTILKYATRLPEYGFENRPVHLLIENKRIASVGETVPEAPDAEVID
jgi:imidazolonepropionase-like amidohydrolase